MKLSITHAPRGSLPGYVAPRRVSTLVVGDIEYDRDDRGHVLPVPHDVAEHRRDVLVERLARRTGLPCADIREALEEGRTAREIEEWAA